MAKSYIMKNQYQELSQNWIKITKTDIVHCYMASEEGTKMDFLPMARSSIVMIIFFFNHRWSLCLCVGVHGGLDSQSNLQTLCTEG